MTVFYSGAHGTKLDQKLIEVIEDSPVGYSGDVLRDFSL
jgi:hypothetical protein